MADRVDHLEAAAAAARTEALSPPASALRRICCDSTEDGPHDIECGRPLFHAPREELAALMAAGDPAAQAEWQTRQQVTP